MNPNLSEAKIFYSGLLHIHKALYNEKALFTLFATGLSMMVLTYLGSVLATFGLPMIATLLTFLTMLVVSPAGMSIAGLMLMDQARGQPPRPFRQAITNAIPAFLRTLGIVLLVIVLMVAFSLVLGLLFFVCKLPIVGPALYAVLFPVLAVLAGLLYFSLMAGLSMAYPAVWSGATIREALEMLWRIITNRAAELLVNLLLLAILFALAGFVLFSLFSAGGQIVLGISAPILGTGGALGLAQGLGGLFSATSGSEYALATAFGFMTGLMLFMAAPMSMFMMGLNLIYLQITQDLPPLKKREHARNPAPPKGVNVGNKPAVQGAAVQSAPVQSAPVQSAPVQSAPQPGGNPGGGMSDILSSLLPEANPPPPAPTKSIVAPPICPRCRVTAQLGDRFCGECGGSLGN